MNGNPDWGRRVDGARGCFYYLDMDSLGRQSGPGTLAKDPRVLISRGNPFNSKTSIDLSRPRHARHTRFYHWHAHRVETQFESKIRILLFEMYGDDDFSLKCPRFINAASFPLFDYNFDYNSERKFCFISLLKVLFYHARKYVKNRNNICTFYRVIVYETYYLNSPGKHLLPHDAVIRWIKILELFYHFYMQIIYWFECNNIYVQILLKHLLIWKREGKINKKFSK